MFTVVQELQEDLGQLGYGRQDFDWAVAVLHSRCFVYGRSSTHMVVPGVDMANHSFTPNAAVRSSSTLPWKVDWVFGCRFGPVDRVVGCRFGPADRVVGSKGVWTEEAGCVCIVCIV